MLSWGAAAAAASGIFSGAGKVLGGSGAETGRVEETGAGSLVLMGIVAAVDRGEAWALAICVRGAAGATAGAGAGLAAGLLATAEAGASEESRIT